MVCTHQSAFKHLDFNKSLPLGPSSTFLLVLFEIRARIECNSSEYIFCYTYFNYSFIDFMFYAHVYPLIEAEHLELLICKQIFEIREIRHSLIERIGRCALSVHAAVIMKIEYFVYTI